MFSPRKKLEIMQAKIENAQILKGEKKSMREMKERTERELKESRNQRILELERLEQRYLDEFNIRKIKKSRFQSPMAKKKIKRLKIEVKIEDSLNPVLKTDISENKELEKSIDQSLLTNIPLFDHELFSSLRKDSLISCISNFIKSKDQEKTTLDSDNPTESKALRMKLPKSMEKSKNTEKNYKKHLPVILKPMKSGMFSVHIVGETRKASPKSHSDNNTPTNISVIPDNITETHPSYHMFREFEVIPLHTKNQSTSKSKIMKSYEKNTVKRYFTPIPSLNKKLQIESVKLNSEMKSIYNKLRIAKFFDKKRSLFSPT